MENAPIEGAAIGLCSRALMGLRLAGMFLYAQAIGLGMKLRLGPISCGLLMKTTLAATLRANRSLRVLA